VRPNAVAKHACFSLCHATISGSTAVHFIRACTTPVRSTNPGNLIIIPLFLRALGDLRGEVLSNGKTCRRLTAMSAKGREDGKPSHAPKERSGGMCSRFAVQRTTMLASCRKVTIDYLDQCAVD
jgi:hypothetical protein